MKWDIDFPFTEDLTVFAGIHCPCGTYLAAEDRYSQYYDWEDDTVAVAQCDKCGVAYRFKLALEVVNHD